MSAPVPPPPGPGAGPDPALAAAPPRARSRAPRARSRAAAAGAIVTALALGAFLAFVPPPVDPVAWESPPPAPLVGSWAPDEALRDATLLAAGHVPGPEDVDVDAEGRVYGGLLEER